MIKETAASTVAEARLGNIQKERVEAETYNEGETAGDENPIPKPRTRAYALPMLAIGRPCRQPDDADLHNLLEYGRFLRDEGYAGRGVKKRSSQSATIATF